MEIKKLMSGIAVVIDDALVVEPGAGAEGTGEDDPIGRIVEWFEQKWELPFVKETSLPKTSVWPNLLEAASFVLLDWQLWPSGAAELERRTIREIIEFLRVAKANLVPVFIFTRADPGDVIAKLPNDVYEDPKSGRSFVFVGRKNALWSDNGVNPAMLEKWVHGNASVYALRTWEQVLASAKNELFRAMCGLKVDWPHVFWDTYRTDGAEPSASLTNLISDSLRGRMRLDAFEDEYLGGEFEEVADDELRQLIAETSFRRGEYLPPEEIRCGDLYKVGGGKYLLNLRPDCDCIPRGGGEADDIEVYCVEGKKVGPTPLNDRYDSKTGCFSESVFESVAFAIVDGKSLAFNFKKLCVKKFSAVKKKRVGRLLHPYLTRVQQRYALYSQRQALPRVPKAALPPIPEPSPPKDAM